MNPNPIEIVHTSHEGRPTVAATAPTENSTSAGTPLATQKAPVQSILRCSVPAGVRCAGAAAELVNVPVSCIVHTNCFLNSSAISHMSPTITYLGTLKIEGFESVFTATTVSTCFIPARCWIAPDIPIATYSLQLTAVLPDWPTWRDFGSH